MLPHYETVAYRFSPSVFRARPRPAEDGTYSGYGASVPERRGIFRSATSAVRRRAGDLVIAADERLNGPRGSTDAREATPAAGEAEAPAADEPGTAAGLTPTPAPLTGAEDVPESEATVETEPEAEPGSVPQDPTVEPTFQEPPAPLTGTEDVPEVEPTDEPEPPPGPVPDTPPGKHAAAPPEEPAGPAETAETETPPPPAAPQTAEPEVAVAEAPGAPAEERTADRRGWSRPRGVLGALLATLGRLAGLARRAVTFLWPFLVFGTVLVVLAALVLVWWDPDYWGDVDAGIEQPFVIADAGGRGPGDARQTMQGPVDGVVVDARLNDEEQVVVFGPRGGRLGFLRRYLTTMPPQGTLVVQLETGGPLDPATERKVVEIIDDTDSWDRAWVSTTDPWAITRLRWYSKDTRTVFRITDSGDDAEAMWPLRQEPVRRGVRKFIRPAYMHAEASVDADTVEHLVDQDWPMLVTADGEKRTIGEALELQPYAVITDRPGRASGQVGNR